MKKSISKFESTLEAQLLEVENQNNLKKDKRLASDINKIRQIMQTGSNLADLRLCIEKDVLMPRKRKAYNLFRVLYFDKLIRRLSKVFEMPEYSLLNLVVHSNRQLTAENKDLRKMCKEMKNKIGAGALNSSDSEGQSKELNPLVAIRDELALLRGQMDIVQTNLGLVTEEKTLLEETVDELEQENVTLSQASVVLSSQVTQLQGELQLSKGKNARLVDENQRLKQQIARYAQTNATQSRDLAKEYSGTGVLSQQESRFFNN